MDQVGSALSVLATWALAIAETFWRKMPGHQACGRGGYFAGAPRLLQRKTTGKRRNI